MPESIYTRLGVKPIINCVGYSTRVGGSAPGDAVISAMAEAQRQYIEIDDLQAAAWRIIAEQTGAEGGIVTCGAGAALTLAAAACIAGSDVDRMDQLPDTTRITRNRIIYPQLGYYDYDHAIRLSGGPVDAVDYDSPRALELIEQAITPATAAVGYVWQRTGQNPDVKDVAELAHRHQLPLILDAALALPPVHHLRSFIDAGADLVALSGGKHLGGPQASGLLFGRADLVRSAWLQMVDMDVRPGTWSLQPWVTSGFVARPPRHGIGRSMKVAKEAIVGLLVALQHYTRRNHDAELAQWKQRTDYLATELAKLPLLKVEQRFPAPNGQPYPVVQIDHPGGMSALLNRLRTNGIILAEDEQNPARAYLFPMCLKDSELETIVAAFTRVVDQ